MSNKIDGRVILYFAGEVLTLTLLAAGTALVLSGAYLLYTKAIILGCGI